MKERGEGRWERAGDHCYRGCVSRKEGTMTEDERMKSGRKTLREERKDGGRGRWMERTNSCTV